MSNSIESSMRLSQPSRHKAGKDDALKPWLSLHGPVQTRRGIVAFLGKTPHWTAMAIHPPEPNLGSNLRTDACACARPVCAGKDRSRPPVPVSRKRPLHPGISPPSKSPAARSVTGSADSARWGKKKKSSNARLARESLAMPCFDGNAGHAG
jgi:hypothetical protein